MNRQERLLSDAVQSAAKGVLALLLGLCCAVGCAYLSMDEAAAPLWPTLGLGCLILGLCLGGGSMADALRTMRIREEVERWVRRVPSDQ